MNTFCKFAFCAVSHAHAQAHRVQHRVPVQAAPGFELQTGQLSITALMLIIALIMKALDRDLTTASSRQACRELCRELCRESAALCKPTITLTSYKMGCFKTLPIAYLLGVVQWTPAAPRRSWQSLPHLHALHVFTYSPRFCRNTVFKHVF